MYDKLFELEEIISENPSLELKFEYGFYCLMSDPEQLLTEQIERAIDYFKQCIEHDFKQDFAYFYLAHIYTLHPDQSVRQNEIATYHKFIEYLNGRDDSKNKNVYIALVCQNLAKLYLADELIAKDDDIAYDFLLKATKVYPTVSNYVLLSDIDYHRKNYPLMWQHLNLAWQCSQNDFNQYFNYQCYDSLLYRIGFCLNHGIGIQKDEALAKKYLREAELYRPYENIQNFKTSTCFPITKRKDQ